MPAIVASQIRIDRIAAWVAAYRELHPKSRAEHPYRILHNGGIKRVYESLIDGSTVSMDARWPITGRVVGWMAAQDDAAARISEEQSKAKMIKDVRDRISVMEKALCSCGI